MKRSKHLIIVGFGIVAAVLVGLFTNFDIQSKREYSVLYNEMEKMRQNSLEPAGAIEWTEISYSPYLRGNGAWARIGCIDIRCPIVGRNWMVPLSPGEATPFAKMILRNEGYSYKDEYCPRGDTTNTCFHTGNKDGLELEVMVQTLGSIRPPDKDVSPKVWILVRTTLTKPD